MTAEQHVAAARSLTSERQLWSRAPGIPGGEERIAATNRTGAFDLESDAILIGFDESMM
jgi:hypothetical protein